MVPARPRSGGGPAAGDGAGAPARQHPAVRPGPLGRGAGRVGDGAGRGGAALRCAGPAVAAGAGRLALREVSDLSWWTGDRLGAERIALWVTLRAGSTRDTERALARAGWAMRRLSE